jgi:hypothetical protein
MEVTPAGTVQAWGVPVYEKLTVPDPGEPEEPPEP